MNGNLVQDVAVLRDKDIMFFWWCHGHARVGLHNKGRIVMFIRYILGITLFLITTSNVFADFDAKQWEYLKKNREHKQEC